jgi:hypothetical protein
MSSGRAARRERGCASIFATPTAAPAEIALVLMQFFGQTNEGRNVIKFREDFWPLIEALRQRIHAPRDLAV